MKMSGAPCTFGEHPVVMHRHEVAMRIAPATMTLAVNGKSKRQAARRLRGCHSNAAMSGTRSWRSVVGRFELEDTESLTADHLAGVVDICRDPRDEVAVTVPVVFSSDTDSNTVLACNRSPTRK